MRILLYTGKGGVGKTSVSAATALRCAELGYRTIVVSTDSAHSLADSFDLPLGPEPTPVAPNLWGQEVDILYQMDKYWGNMQRYMASVFAWTGLESIVAEELTVLPGMEDLASLVEIVHLHDSGAYDVIIMDCAPTGATLQLLTLPEIGHWYLDKIFPWKRKAVAATRPLLHAITSLPIPDDQVFEAIGQLMAQLERMQDLLTDRERASARLVLNPEKMVIKEAQRAYTYLNLYGYSTDMVICNRVLPSQVQDAYFQEWHTIQAQYQQTVQEAFAPLPILSVPLFGREVVGLEMLRQMGQAIFGDRDPADIFYLGEEMRIVRTDNTYTLIIPLPFVASAEVQVTRSSADELIVHIGNHKRVITLPHTLSPLEVQRAHHENVTLTLVFGQPASDET
ncbi:MAG: ArsA family ATPase [Anaerolineae bacterium]|nr:ArsA family ATPase [Anaerolineae bacterium]